MSSLARVVAFAPLFLALFLLQDPVRLPLADAVRIWTYQESADQRCPVDSLLVMGAAQYDGAPSPAFRRRLDRAFELYAAGCVERIVVSGGRRAGDRYSEGESGTSYLHGRGVPAEALLAESEATTSFENVRNSAPLVRDGRVLIVTDDMHAFRTLWLADKLGLDAAVVTVATESGRLAYGGRELMGLLAYQVGYLR